LLGKEPATAVLEKIAEQDFNKPVGRKRVIDLGKQAIHDVSTDSLADDNTIAFLSKGKSRADKYGRWLRKEAGVKSLRVYMQGLTGENKSRGFWLFGFSEGSYSVFYCGGRVFYGDFGSLFGVYESAEGTSRKISPKTRIKAPTLSQVLRYSRPFIPSRDKKEFEAGMRNLFKNQ
jgi:hypothetical protein